MKFRMLTREELIEEWRTEYDIQDLFDGGGHSLLSKGVYDHEFQKEIFLEVMSNTLYQGVWKVETFHPQAVGLDGWYGETIEDICATTNHMFKDPKSIRDAYVNNTSELPYVLVQKTITGAYKTLGGRTRCGVAHLLGLPVTAIVIDAKKVGTIILEAVRLKLMIGKDSDMEYYSELGIDTYDLFYAAAYNMEYEYHSDIFFHEMKVELLYDSIRRLMKKYGLAES